MSMTVCLCIYQYFCASTKLNVGYDSYSTSVRVEALENPVLVMHDQVCSA
jgi:hypothetical protein